MARVLPFNFPLRTTVPSSVEAAARRVSDNPLRNTMAAALRPLAVLVREKLSRHEITGPDRQDVPLQGTAPDATELGMVVFCPGLASMALGEGGAEQFVEVLVAERVEIGVAGGGHSTAEVRIGGDDLG